MPTNFQLWSEYRLLAMEFAEIGGALLHGNVSTPAISGAEPSLACAAAGSGAPVGPGAAAGGGASLGVHARSFDDSTQTVWLVANPTNVSLAFSLGSPLLPAAPGASAEVLPVTCSL